MPGDKPLTAKQLKSDRDKRRERKSSTDPVIVADIPDHGGKGQKLRVVKHENSRLL